MNELEAFDPRTLADIAEQPAAPAAIATLMQHAQAMNAARQLADALCDTDIVPALYRGKPGNGAAAILYGAELGLNPIQSLQQIFVVQGKPAIYARTMVALLKAKGFVFETVQTGDDLVTVQATDPRTGVTESATWDYARAKKAGYTSNKKYDTDPQAMLYAKAATEVARKIAPEILLGIGYSVEDLEVAPVKATAVRADTPRKSVTEVLAEPDPEPEVVEEPGTPMSTPDQWKRLAILLGKEKIDSREGKLDYLESQFGRKFTSSKELTRDEAEGLITFLADAQAADDAG